MVTYKTNLPILSLKYTPSEYQKVKISTSLDLFDVFKEHYNMDTVEYREEMYVLYLNQANNTVGLSRHSMCSTTHTVIDPKIIFTEALLCGAAAIAISHNHPSALMKPSKEDEYITSKINEGCKLMNIRFLDHIIISGDMNSYYSFSDEGKI